MTHQGASTLPPLDELAVFSVNLTKAEKFKSVREFVHIGKPPRRVNHGVACRTEPAVEGTGEIFQAEDAGIPHLDLATMNEARRATFNALRHEVQEFATFVLMFRNHRRGITPGIGKLCQGYADLTGKRADNVRRHIPTLRDAEILVGDNAVGRLWQRTGATSKDVLAEEYEAWSTYKVRAARRFGPNKITGRLDTSLAATDSAARLTAEVIAKASRPEIEHATAGT